MKILTLVGTRPELIRLSIIISKLNKITEHILVHTGQNYDYELSQIFFKELKIKKPDYFLDARGTFSEQISIMFPKFEKIIKKEKPDRVLILGDTNSSLCSIICKRLQIPVFHMEAGNRSYDNRMPEEVNRKLIDHSSSILLPYSNSSMMNLIQEGIPKNKIYVTGNPIYEVINHFSSQINRSQILKKLKIKKNNYLLVTIHREENVDEKLNFKNILTSLNELATKHHIKIVWPIHPRSKLKYKKQNINLHSNIILVKPSGFFDFVKLERESKCVLTDSGTVQEECSIFSKPYLVLRSTTERPEALEMGSGILCGLDPKNVLKSYDAIMKFNGNYSIPKDYISPHNSDIVIKLLFGVNI